MPFVDPVPHSEKPLATHQRAAEDRSLVLAEQRTRMSDSDASRTTVSEGTKGKELTLTLASPPHTTWSDEGAGGTLPFYDAPAHISSRHAKKRAAKAYHVPHPTPQTWGFRFNPYLRRVHRRSSVPRVIPFTRLLQQKATPPPAVEEGGAVSVLPAEEDTPCCTPTSFPEEVKEWPVDAHSATLTPPAGSAGAVTEADSPAAADADRIIGDPAASPSENRQRPSTTAPVPSFGVNASHNARLPFTPLLTAQPTPSVAVPALPALGGLSKEEAKGQPLDFSIEGVTTPHTFRSFHQALKCHGGWVKIRPSPVPGTSEGGVDHLIAVCDELEAVGEAREPRRMRVLRGELSDSYRLGQSGGGGTAGGSPSRVLEYGGLVSATRSPGSGGLTNLNSPAISCATGLRSPMSVISLLPRSTADLRGEDKSETTPSHLLREEGSGPMRKMPPPTSLCKSSAVVHHSASASGSERRAEQSAAVHTVSRSCSVSSCASSLCHSLQFFGGPHASAPFSNHLPEKLRWWQSAIPLPLELAPRGDTFGDAHSGMDVAETPYYAILSNYRQGSFLYYESKEEQTRFLNLFFAVVRDIRVILEEETLHRDIRLFPVVNAPAYVFGDIHGNFEDLSFFLRRVLLLNDLHLTPVNLICLGDYVDRGDFSLECVMLLFSLKLMSPGKLIMLRGNHEDRAVCGDLHTYGTKCFAAQCQRLFGFKEGMKLFNEVTDLFRYLPLAAELRVFTPPPLPSGLILSQASYHSFLMGDNTEVTSPSGASSLFSQANTAPAPPGHCSWSRILCTHGGIPRFVTDPLEHNALEMLRSIEFPRMLSLFPDHASIRTQPEARIDYFHKKLLPSLLERYPAYKSVRLERSGLEGEKMMPSRKTFRLAWGFAFDFMWSDPMDPEQEASDALWYRQRRSEVPQMNDSGLHPRSCSSGPEKTQSDSSPAKEKDRISRSQPSSPVSMREVGFGANKRGANILSFSSRAVNRFLQAYGYLMVFRAHQEKSHGLRLSQSNQVLTIFTSSDYMSHGNGGGCAVVAGTGEIQMIEKLPERAYTN